MFDYTKKHKQTSNKFTDLNGKYSGLFYCSFFLIMSILYFLALCLTFEEYDAHFPNTVAKVITLAPLSNLQ